MKVFISLILLSSFLFSQEKYTISGYVKDAETGESLISAAVAIPGAKTGANTNAYGFYSITLPEGTYKIVTSYVGYSKYEKEINLNQDLKLDIELEPDAVLSEEVVVTARKQDANIKSVELSTIELSTATIKKIPAFLGEVDVVRAIQLQPGVTTVGEGATGFNVRGGSIDQNLVLLDEAPVYNQSHLFGFFSVFNPDATKDVKLYKAGIPSVYGGRLSSILDVRLKEGSDRRHQAQGGIGTIFSRFASEGPLIENKLSYLIAGRRSYIDVLAGPFLEDGLENSQFYFYDLTAKLNWKIDDENTVFASGFFGRDVFGLEFFRFDWGSQTGTLRWNHLFSDKLFSNLTYYFSNYDYLLRFGELGQDAFQLRNRVQTQSLKYDFEYFVASKNSVKFGVEGIYYLFVPGESEGASDGFTEDVSIPNKYGVQAGYYIDHEVDLFKNLTVRYGARLSSYHYLNDTAYVYGEPDGLIGFRSVVDTLVSDGITSKADYFNFEPRVALRYQLGENNSIKASYDRTVQYLHLLSNTAAATPVDQWTTSTNDLQPQLADIYTIGYFQNFYDNSWETSVETYYKDYQNALEFVDGADLTLDETVERKLLAGIGRSYGVELFIKKNTGKFTGFLSYTLARTERQIDGINNGEWFPTRFDQTHNINLSTFYELNKKWSFGGNFVYITGTPVTFPTGGYYIDGIWVPHNSGNQRNQQRIGDFIRVDISATYKPKQDPDDWWEGEWVFSIYNLLNRRNPFSEYPQLNANGDPQFIRFSVIGSIVPAVTYNFNFDVQKLVDGE